MPCINLPSLFTSSVLYFSLIFVIKWQQWHLEYVKNKLFFCKKSIVLPKQEKEVKVASQKKSYNEGLEGQGQVI